MAVKFLKGTAAQYAALTTPVVDTFYFIDNTDLYLGSIKLSNAADLADAVARVAENEQAIVTINETLAVLTSDGEGSVAKMVEDAKAELQAQLGDVTALETVEKTNVVSAINELKTLIGTTGSAGIVTIEESESSDYAKVYTFKQNGAAIGAVNIPKDMVVKSGQVVENPEGQPAGTYLEITLANATEDKIYVNVGTLVDIYTVQANAAQVQLSMVGREISATIVAGSVGTTELADAAVVTAKIADANVTLAKLDVNVQASLGKADSALQVADITAGAANGAIAVRGADVQVTGLKSAAFMEAADFDAAGSAKAVEDALNAYKEANDAAVKKNADDIAAINNEETGVLALAKADATEKADKALEDAKAYVDEQVEAAMSWGTME